MGTDKGTVIGRKRQRHCATRGWIRKTIPYNDPVRIAHIIEAFLHNDGRVGRIRICRADHGVTGGALQPLVQGRRTICRRDCQSLQEDFVELTVAPE